MKISKNQSLVLLFAFLTICAGIGLMHAAVPQSTIRTTGGVTTYVGHYFNFTQGLYQGTTERVDAAGNAVFTTVDTGLGANELYGMDQNVLTTSDVNFSSVEADEFYLNSVKKTDILAYPQQPVSYIIWENTGIYYVKNATSGIVYSNVDQETLVNTHISGGGTIYLRDVSLGKTLDGLSDAGPEIHYSIVLGSNINETETVTVKSYVDVDFKGYKLTSTTNSVTIYAKSIHDANWRNGVIESQSTTDSHTCFSFRHFTEHTFLVEHMIIIQNGAGASTTAVGFIDESSPTLNDVTAIAGAGGSNCVAFRVSMSAAPICYSCSGYGGNSNQNGNAWEITHSASPSLVDCQGITGASNTVYAWRIEGNSAPYLENCEGRPNRYNIFFEGTGNGNTTVADSMSWNNWESDEKDNTGGWVLETISIRIMNPVPAATIDIGTSVGGNEIADDIPATILNDRPSFSFNQVTLYAGTSIYITPSDAAVQWSCRPVVTQRRNAGYGLCMNTYGPAIVNGGVFIGSPYNGAGGLIGDKAKSAKKYSITGATFKTITKEHYGLIGNSTDSEPSPIKNCQIFGDYTNLTIGNHGNVTLAAGSSRVQVPHGCDYIPRLGDIQITPNRDLGNCTYFWMGNVTSTHFYIYVGASGAEKNIDTTTYFLWDIDQH